MNFMDTLGEVPENFIYDRGGDSKKNLSLLNEVGVENICIFPKGRSKDKCQSRGCRDGPKREIFERSIDRKFKVKKVQFHQAKSSVAGEQRPQGFFQQCWGSISISCFETLALQWKSEQKSAENIESTRASKRK